MSGPTVRAEPLTAEAFAPFGHVVEARGEPDRLINAGLCGRWHDVAPFDIEGRAGLSLFLAEPRPLPYRLDLLERHPLGSQAFVPMTEHPFLVIVALDAGGVPGAPRAFLAGTGQGVAYARATWHGVLAPLSAPGRFAVIDRVDPSGGNLEEHRLDPPVLVTA